MSACRGVRGAVLALATVVALTGCGKVVAGTATVGAAAGTAGGGGDVHACNHVDAPMADISAQDDSEPLLRVPQPAGWVRDASLDNTLIRYRMVDNSLAKYILPPNIVVSLVHISNVEPKAEFDKQQQALQAMPANSNLVSSRGKQCGYPAASLSFNQPPIAPGTPPRALRVRSMLVGKGAHQFLVTATVQTNDPDNPAYQKDAQIMLDGLQVTTPGV